MAGGSPSNPELLDIAARIADRAGPGEQIEAFVARSTSTSVKAYGGEVESLTQASSAGVGVRVVVDHREGFAYAGTLDEAVVLDALAEARDNASFGEPDEFNGLATPDGVDEAELDLWPAGLADVATADKVALALDLERATIGRDPRVNGVRVAMYSDSLGEGAVATSTGIRSWGRAGMSYLMVQALALQDGETQIEAGLSVGREVSDLSIDEAADDAVLRATRLLGSTKPPTQRITLVLEPRMTATILGIVGGMLNGEAVLKGRSPFGDRVGEAIASPLLTFVDDPTDPRSLGAETHDGEGLARRRNELVADGRLQGFLHNTYTGRRSGTASTGSAQRGVSSTPAVGASALAVAPGVGTHEEVLGAIDNGLFVTSMAGLHSGVNPVSGDFSVGVEGLMVRGGALAEPVREATIASTIQRLLLDISAVGADLEWLPDGSGGVTLVIPDVALSGASDHPSMPIVHAIALGITQGLSEFLPISSSGHLRLVPWLFGWDDFAGQASLEKTFDVALHLGTLIGAIAYFRADIVRLVRAGLRRDARETTDGRLAWLLVVSTVPAAVTGALFADVIERKTGYIWLIATMLIVFGVVLGWADRRPGARPVEDVRLRDALLMGAGQAVALQPGVSRSGVTMTAGRLVGLSRDGAARFAFLMSLPITAGALVFKGVDVAGDGIPDGFAAPFVWGIVASGITGWFAVWGTLRLIRTRTFAPFVAYRVVAGVAVLVLYAIGH